MKLTETVIIIFALTIVAAGHIANASQRVRASSEFRQSINFNLDWKFYRGDATGAEAPTYNDATWKQVALPHAIDSLTSVSAPKIYQGIAWYRKHFTPDASLTTKEVYLEIGAAMQKCDVWINGTLLTNHCGGWQKFVMDLTGKLNFGADNVIACKLDNRDTYDCVPGKEEASLDFHYYGGLYRDVCLQVYNPVHISDPLSVDKAAGGGVYFTTSNVTAGSATVNVRTHVVNESAQPAVCRVVSILLDTAGKEVVRITSDTVRIAAQGENQFVQNSQVATPALWSPEWPNLYTLISRVENNGAALDSMNTRVGIRTITMSLTNGMSLNGKRYWLFGSNRHQEFPYLAFAVSANMQRRDAVVLKNMGVNMVRHGHYPAHTAFLDACDELGLFVGEPIPGWQKYIDNNAVFKASAYKAIQELIRRDRNHPCLLMFECSLNESYPPAAFEQQCQTTAKAEFIGDQLFTSGDQSNWDIAYNYGSATKIRYLREYGDWAFGGNGSTTRQKRGAGEQKLLQQVWNFYWDHNAAESGSWPHAQNVSRDRLLGSGLWCFNDYNRGYYSVTCYAGAVDQHRLPKLAYLWCQSYRDPAVDWKSTLVQTGPVVNIGNYWTTRTSPTKIVAWSNCEEVELFVNNISIGKQKPDTGPDLNYNSTTVTGYTGADGSGGYPWGGGCCTYNARPAFTFFDKTYSDGELKAVGYIAGTAVAQQIVRTPGSVTKMAIFCSLNGVQLAANDEVFLYASLLDNNSTVVPTATNAVTFSVTGSAKIIGVNPVAAEVGVAAALLKTDPAASGSLNITATTSGISPVTITVPISDPVSVAYEGVPHNGKKPAKMSASIVLAKSSRGRIEKAILVMPKPGRMKLELFDLSGRLLHTIAQENLSAGCHAFGLGNLHLSGGVVIVRLKTGGSVVVKKFCQVK